MKNKGKITIKGISKREFKRELRIKTGCSIQYNGWTCGTCFNSVFKGLSLNDWKSVLIYRGDYNPQEVNKWVEEEGSQTISKEEIEKSINKIWELIK